MSLGLEVLIDFQLKIGKCSHTKASRNQSKQAVLTEFQIFLMLLTMKRLLAGKCLLNR
jgi:hypothetical protein